MVDLDERILPYIYYMVLVTSPFLIFCSVSSACRDKQAPVRSVTVLLSQYVAKLPFWITLYHLVLTLALCYFSVQQVAQNMNVAVDLTYYTKTSIRATEVS